MCDRGGDVNRLPLLRESNLEVSRGDVGGEFTRFCSPDFSNFLGREESFGVRDLTLGGSAELSLEYDMSLFNAEYFECIPLISLDLLLSGSSIVCISFMYACIV